MKRLLLTGGRGFIGRHCLAPAVAAGFEVWATTSAIGQPPTDLRNLPIEWRTIDLLQPGAIEALVSELKPSHVLHTAWETNHGSYWTSANNLLWLALGARFFGAFAANGGKRFVTTGTCAEYDWTHGYMVEDATPERPRTFYGQMKLAHHFALMAAAEQLEFSAVTGRVFFAYGPHENANRIVPYTCAQLVRSEPANLARGRQLRDFMFVEDVAEGFVALLESKISGTCNVCSGTPIALADVANLIGASCGRPELIQLGARPDRSDDPPMLVGDNARLLTTGWKPKRTIDAGLRQTFEWWSKKFNSLPAEVT